MGKRAHRSHGSGHAVADAAVVKDVGRVGRVVAQLAAETPRSRVPASGLRSDGPACPTRGAAAIRTSPPGRRWFECTRSTSNSVTSRVTGGRPR